MINYKNDKKKINTDNLYIIYKDYWIDYPNIKIGR